MKQTFRRWGGFTIRWAIAIVGIVWVISNLHLSDRVLVLDDENRPVERTLASSADESATSFEVNMPGGVERVSRDRLVNPPDRKEVLLQNDALPVPLLGMKLVGDLNKRPRVSALLVQIPSSGARIFVPPSSSAERFELQIPQPLVQIGMGSMLRQADTARLVAAVAIIGLTYLFTTVRWHRLLDGLGIAITLRRAFVLNMVGSFYNAFMLGSTGGDVIKAWYAARQVPGRRTAAVMSVIIDRVIGLLALIMLGGSMAAWYYATASDRSTPTSIACRRVALVAAVSLAGTLAFLLIVYSPRLRKFFGYDAIASRLPMRAQVEKVVDVVRIYKRRPMLIFAALMLTFPVHFTVIVSAMLAGHAFNLPISSGYYFIVVPVLVLVSAVPISPQGVGVMEAFAFYLTRQQGMTVNGALALTMSIRMVAIFWNLLGGIFVLRGGFHTPTEGEQKEVERLPLTDSAATVI